MRTGVASVTDLMTGGFRLDASYHANEGSNSFHHLNRWANLDLRLRRLDQVGNVCLPNGIFIGGRAKRIYVDDPAHGIPFLSSSDMLLTSFESVKFISKKQPDIDASLLHPGWTLISRSGTIGNTAYVRRDMEGLAGSEHIMRVVADPRKIRSGYLYAFLSSEIGISMIRQGTFGAVIDTIEPKYVASLPVPRLVPTQEEQIHQLIEKAADLRNQANQFKLYAQNLVAQLLNVQLDGSAANNKTAYISVDNLNDRFEATYHSAQKSASAFAKSSYPLIPIGNLLERIFYLGKLHRVFVEDSDSGVPLLSISDVQKAKLTSTKFISRFLSRNVDDAILSRGWVLISRVGTPGLAIYTRREMEGFAGTDHLVRLVPNQSKTLPGFLFSILSSPVGQKLLKSSAHGSVQLVLPPEYIEQIRIPLPPIDSQKEIHDLIEKYGESLTLASELEDQAQRILSVSLGTAL